jgi:hypothetical protein
VGDAFVYVECPLEALSDQLSAFSFSIDVFSAGTETGLTKTIDRHTGRDKAEIRYPPAGDSGMTWEITSCVNTSSKYFFCLSLLEILAIAYG